MSILTSHFYLIFLLNRKKLFPLDAIIISLKEMTVSSYEIFHGLKTIEKEIHFKNEAIDINHFVESTVAEQR